MHSEPRVVEAGHHRPPRHSHQQTHLLRLYCGSPQHPDHPQHRICLQISLCIHKVSLFNSSESVCLSQFYHKIEMAKSLLQNIYFLIFILNI